MNLIKIISFIFILILIINMILFGLGIINDLTFWFIIIFGAGVSYIINNKLKKK